MSRRAGRFRRSTPATRRSARPPTRSRSRTTSRSRTRAGIEGNSGSEAGSTWTQDLSLQIHQRQQLAVVLAASFTVNRRSPRRRTPCARPAVSSTIVPPSFRISTIASSSSFTCSAALELDCVAHGGAHLVLQRLRPRVERRPVEEDRTREIEVVRSRCGSWWNLWTP